MIRKRFIQSLLENDLSKYMMAQIFFHNEEFKNLNIKYIFKYYDREIRFNFKMLRMIYEQIQEYSKLRYSSLEIEYLKSLKLLKPDFIDFLKNWKPNTNIINLIYFPTIEKLEIVFDGNILDIILLKSPIMAIISESYYSSFENYNQLYLRCITNIKDILNDFEFNYFDFSFKYRLSYEYQVDLLKIIKQIENKYFKGTSNIYLAKELNLKAIGMIENEYFKIGEYIFNSNIEQVKEKMLKLWSDEYSKNNELNNKYEIIDIMKNKIYLSSDLLLNKKLKNKYEIFEINYLKIHDFNNICIDDEIEEK